MLGKKPRPVIGKIPGTFWPGSDSATSPRSPLEVKIQSPRGLKNYDLGGVGLGIVAALDKTEVRTGKTMFSQNFTRSSPIPVRPSTGCGRKVWEETDPDSLEDYTFVTRHEPNKASTTRVYCEGVEYGKAGLDRRGNFYRAPVFDISPARFSDAGDVPTADFLSSCHLCHKKLLGKDIYMYRGEKAFCSTECRYRQIVMDERKEQCSSEASRSAEVSHSPCSNGQIFSAGILAV
ncbi:hypothetical protein NMG60_11005633 [Bertholletia excelsa]